MFIVLEGIDCTGKSTVCRLLARHMDATDYATPPREIAERRELIDRDATPEDHYAFYVHGNMLASAEIESYLLEGKRVICDRYWLTTLVYHRAMGMSVSANDFCRLRQPDLTVLLTVSPSIQAQRFIERGMSAGDRRMLNSQAELATLYQEALGEIRGNTLVIDTDTRNPSDVVHVIHKYLQ